MRSKLFVVRSGEDLVFCRLWYTKAENLGVLSLEPLALRLHCTDASDAAHVRSPSTDVRSPSSGLRSPSSDLRSPPLVFDFNASSEATKQLRSDSPALTALYEATGLFGKWELVSAGLPPIERFRNRTDNQSECVQVFLETDNLMEELLRAEKKLPLPEAPFPEKSLQEMLLPETPLPETPLPETPLPETPLQETRVFRCIDLIADSPVRPSQKCLPPKKRSVKVSVKTPVKRSVPADGDAPKTSKRAKLPLVSSLPFYFTDGRDAPKTDNRAKPLPSYVCLKNNSEASLDEKTTLGAVDAEKAENADSLFSSDSEYCPSSTPSSEPSLSSSPTPSSFSPLSFSSSSSKGSRGSGGSVGSGGSKGSKGSRGSSCHAYNPSPKHCHRELKAFHNAELCRQYNDMVAFYWPKKAAASLDKSENTQQLQQQQPYALFLDGPGLQTQRELVARCGFTEERCLVPNPFEYQALRAVKGAGLFDLSLGQLLAGKELRGKRVSFAWFDYMCGLEGFRGGGGVGGVDVIPKADLEAYVRVHARAHSLLAVTLCLRHSKYDTHDYKGGSESYVRRFLCDLCRSVGFYFAELPPTSVYGSAMFVLAGCLLPLRP